MPQDNPAKKAYLVAAEAAEAEGDWALAGHLKVLALRPPEREGPDPEVVRLNKEIAALEAARRFPEAGRVKTQLLRYVSKRDSQ